MGGKKLQYADQILIKDTHTHTHTKLSPPGIWLLPLWQQIKVYLWNQTKK